MWVVINREARPAAPVWTGRRWLAAVDAVAWPAAWIIFVLSAPFDAHAVGQVVVAFAVWRALARLHRAVWMNHRYWFTTWRWGRVVLMMLMMAYAMKWTASL